MSTKVIGSILSAQGVIQTIATFIVFPWISGKLGRLATFRLAIFSYPLLYLLVPYLAVLPEGFRTPVLYTVVVWKVTAQAFAFPPLQIFLANSAPSKTVLGTLNGCAASSASLCRAIGPTLSGVFQAAGLSVGCVGLPWWSSSAIAIVGAALSLYIQPKQTQPLPTLGQISELHSGATDVECTVSAGLPVRVAVDPDSLPPRKH